MPTYLVESDLRRGSLVMLALREREPVRAAMEAVWRALPPLGRAGRMLLEALLSDPPIVPKIPEELSAPARRRRARRVIPSMSRR
jgi:hypothetical protein